MVVIVAINVDVINKHTVSVVGTYGQPEFFKLILPTKHMRECVS